MRNFFLIVVLQLLILGCAHLHKYDSLTENSTFGSSLSDKEINNFHIRTKSHSHHIDITREQYEKIENLLGRKTEIKKVKYSDIHRKRPRNRKGLLIGKHFKIEKNFDGGNFTLFIGIHNEDIAEIRLVINSSEDADHEIVEGLFSYFLGHNFRTFSDERAKILNSESFENAEIFHAHNVHLSKETIIHDMKHLSEMEKKYSILSLIQESLAVNLAI